MNCEVRQEKDCGKAVTDENLVVSVTRQAGRHRPVRAHASSVKYAGWKEAGSPPDKPPFREAV